MKCLLTCDFNHSLLTDTFAWFALILPHVIGITLTPVAISPKVLFYRLSCHFDARVSHLVASTRVDAFLRMLVFRGHPLSYTFEDDLTGGARSTADGYGLLFDNIIDGVWMLQEAGEIILITRHIRQGGWLKYIT